MLNIQSCFSLIVWKAHFLTTLALIKGSGSYSQFYFRGPPVDIRLSTISLVWKRICSLSLFSFTLYLQATRCSLTHFPDVHFPFRSPHILYLFCKYRSRGHVLTLWPHGFTESWWGTTLTVCQKAANLLCVMAFVCFPTTASIFIRRFDWNHIKSKAKLHWFPFVELNYCGAHCYARRRILQTHTFLTDQLTAVQTGRERQGPTAQPRVYY